MTVTRQGEATGRKQDDEDDLDLHCAQFSPQNTSSACHVCNAIYAGMSSPWTFMLRSSLEFRLQAGRSVSEPLRDRGTLFSALSSQ